MKIYFDTTCWIRSVENVINVFLQKEKQAINKIFGIIEKHTDIYEIISSKTQLDQVYIKKNSGNSTNQQKNALTFVIALIESKAGTSVNSDPVFSNNIRDNLFSQLQLPDREDVKHIAIAWLREVDYFVTIDWKSIINLNKNREIENALISMQHPVLQTIGTLVEIIDARSFYKIIQKN